MPKRDNLPLRISTSEEGPPTVVLAGQELARHLAKEGLQIRYVEDKASGLSVPEITMTFGPGALDLDFDVELLQTMLEEAMVE